MFRVTTRQVGCGLWWTPCDIFDCELACGLLQFTGVACIHGAFLATPADQ